MFTFGNCLAPLVIDFKSALGKVQEKIESLKNILKPHFPIISYNTNAVAEAAALSEKVDYKSS